MKPLCFSAATAWLLLGVVSAFAQGLPPGTVPPVYGSRLDRVSETPVADQDGRSVKLQQANARAVALHRAGEPRGASTSGGG